MKKFTLEHKNESQRFYRLHKKINRCKRFDDISGDMIEDLKKSLRPEWEIQDDLTSGVDLICISDAKAHQERLAFPAFTIKNIADGRIEYARGRMHIDGEMTFSIYGGDSESIRDDGVYLRHLLMINYTEDKNEKAE